MHRNISFFLAVVFFATSFWACTPSPDVSFGSGTDWYEYQGGPDRNQYSTLNQINRENVSHLEVAWEYHTEDTGQVQTNPIIVNDTLYGMTATVRPFALNAATGEEYWSEEGDDVHVLNSNRGVVYWKEGSDSRVLYTRGEWLYALHALTGEPVESFGDSGRVSLKAGLDEDAADKMVMSTTPGTVYKDKIIMPLRVGEGSGAADGHIQAFNIKTGEIEWVFHTIPKPGEFGHDTWPEGSHDDPDIGGANNWAGMSVDRERGIVFVPTGSAAYDFYGGNRKGANLFANSLIALNAETGERIWHFQFVHHDILDRDLPAPPNLITVAYNGRSVDAVAQITKHGYVFLFDRETGEPLFEIEERAVPPSHVPGEEAWPTQPFPVKPEPYARQTLTANDISPYAENRDELIEIFQKSRFEGPFTPLSAEGTIIFPGLDGGGEWGGAAADPDGIIYLNSNQMAWLISLGPVMSEEQLAGLSSGARTYVQYCTACHRSDRSGSPASGYPSLRDLDGRLDRDHVENVIENGRNMMPAFGSQLSDEKMEVLIAFLYEEEEDMDVTDRDTAEAQSGDVPKVSYQISGYTRFLDSKGNHAIRPPWGTLNAIDMNTGEYLWKVTLGDQKEIRGADDPPTGSENYGGPVVTAGGLLLIAGTKDGMFRVFDKTNGELLWGMELSAAAFATPSTYEVEGKQYIVIACGGTKLGTPGGDSYIAFALPDSVLKQTDN